jgi:DNA-binding transcriptional regulator PaaX
MPTDWTSYRARHVYAKASRFLTEDAIAVLDVQQHEPLRAPLQPAHGNPRVEIPAMEHLFG